jgi:Cu+-exporting ATPase
MTPQTTSFAVHRMSCLSCFGRISAAVVRLPGVVGVRVDLRSGRVHVGHLATTTPDELAAAITSAGYPATVHAQGTAWSLDPARG